MITTQCVRCAKFWTHNSNPTWIDTEGHDRRTTTSRWCPNCIPAVFPTTNFEGFP